MGLTKAPRRQRSFVIATLATFLEERFAPQSFNARMVAIRTAGLVFGLTPPAALTPAQMTMISMHSLWRRAIASVRAWERSAPWATDARVLEDLTNFINFVERASDEIVAEHAAPAVH